MSSELHPSSSLEAEKKRSGTVNLSWKAARPRIDATISSDESMTYRLSFSRLSDAYAAVCRYSTFIGLSRATRARRTH